MGCGPGRTPLVPGAAHLEHTAPPSFQVRTDGYPIPLLHGTTNATSRGLCTEDTQQRALHAHSTCTALGTHTHTPIHTHNHTHKQDGMGQGAILQDWAKVLSCRTRPGPHPTSCGNGLCEHQRPHDASCDREERRGWETAPPTAGNITSPLSRVMPTKSARAVSPSLGKPCLCPSPAEASFPDMRRNPTGGQATPHRVGSGKKGGDHRAVGTELSPPTLAPLQL